MSEVHEDGVYSNAAKLLLSFQPAVSTAVDVLRKECTRRPGVVVAVNTDHPHGITIFGCFFSDTDTFSVDSQSARVPTPCMFSDEALSSLHQLGSWKASVPMTLNCVFSALYGYVRPEIDSEVDMSDVQDRIVQAADGVPFRISSYGVERVFQKLVKAPGLPCEGLGVMYQMHHPERVRMFLFQPLVCKVFSKK